MRHETVSHELHAGRGAMTIHIEDVPMVTDHSSGVGMYGIED